MGSVSLQLSSLVTLESNGYFATTIVAQSGKYTKNDEATYLPLQSHNK